MIAYRKKRFRFGRVARVLEFIAYMILAVGSLAYCGLVIVLVVLAAITK